jgi:hypothetical protein
MPMDQPLSRGLSVGLLADLLIAWAEGEVSEGWLTEVTNIDRITLRGLKADSIDRALAWGTPIMERQSRGVIVAGLRRMTPEGRELFLASHPEYRSAYEASSPPPATSDPPPSSPTSSDPGDRPSSG